MEDCCSKCVKELVCLEAQVEITPAVEVGRIRTICIGDPVFACCPGKTQPCCKFPVSQKICVEIPLRFAANTCVKPGGIACGRPQYDGGYPPQNGKHREEEPKNGKYREEKYEDKCWEAVPREFPEEEL